VLVVLSLASRSRPSPGRGGGSHNYQAQTTSQQASRSSHFQLPKADDKTGAARVTVQRVNTDKNPRGLAGLVSSEQTNTFSSLGTTLESERRA
jgi:hypothetical protein